MWRPLLGGRMGNTLSQSLCRVPAALEVVHPVAAQRRWSSNVRITKQLKKMLDRQGSKKKKTFSGPVHLGSVNTMGSDGDRKKRVYTEGQRRRAHQVGRVLYDNIVHLVNSGQVSPQLANLSVDIVQVKVVPDFSSVNVYWLGTGSEEDEMMGTLLNNNAGQLRHLLTSYHILGSIPRIVFVRDDSQSHYQAVESLLKRADFGPDFVPTTVQSVFRDHAHTQSRNEPSTVDKLQADFNSVSAENFSQNRDRFLQKPTHDEKVVCEGEGTSEEKDAHQSVGGRHESAHSSHIQERHQHMAPSSLEVVHLAKQFLSAGMDVHAGDTMSVTQGFRHDLYGVPQTQLLSKILLRKQKAGTRPNLVSYSEESVSSTLTPPAGGFKLPMLKKKKGRQRRQSDYYGEDSGGERWEDDIEDDFICDEDFEDSDTFPSGPTDRK